MIRRDETLSDVLILEPDIHVDVRGSLVEAYDARALAEFGVQHCFVQDNLVHSRCRVLRGLHFQRWPGQAKLVRVVSGTILDVALDLRRGSATFGTCTAAFLSSDAANALFIPAGFAHGYIALETADVYYKLSSAYDPDQEEGVRWQDPDVPFDWSLLDGILYKPHRFVLSDRDRNASRLSDVEPWP